MNVSYFPGKIGCRGLGAQVHELKKQNSKMKKKLRIILSKTFQSDIKLTMAGSFEPHNPKFYEKIFK